MDDLKRLLQGEAVRPLIGRLALSLDDGNFAAFLALCDDPFNYRIRVWSPELKKQMTWLEHDREGLTELFKSLPEHLQRPGRLHRQVTVATVDPSNTEGYLVVNSSFIVHHTNTEGQTQTLAVGRYLDVVNMTAKTILLTARDVMLETRDFGIGLHVPL